MVDDNQRILEEIKQIGAQYRSEVPGRRKTWPKAIRQRALALNDLGLSYKAISDQTGIPYYTVLNWRTRRGQFKQVATVTVPTSNVVESKPAVTIQNSGTVTVTTPQGYRIDGISLDQLVVLLGKLP